ncbi:MAG: signal peptidase I [Victivallaceae bacterium]
MNTNSSFKSYEKILLQSQKALKKIKHKLSSDMTKEIASLMDKLEKAIKAKHSEQAAIYSDSLKLLMKKSQRQCSCGIKELIKTVLFAFAVAFLIRQFWFELYEVPTGSMRPTIREQDRIVVSKTTFGLRLPFSNKPFFFSENDIQRGSLVVFTVKGMSIPNSDTRYFGIFPGKKRYVKRCVAKPGDTVYFYGGYIYIVDRQGELVNEQSNENYLGKNRIEDIRHVPFISFDGNTETRNQTTFFKQMDKSLGKLLATGLRTKGWFFFQDSWEEDQPVLMKTNRNQPVSYAELMGMNNYAVVHIVQPDKVPNTYKESFGNSPIAYLKIYHTANLTYPSPLISKTAFETSPSLNPYSTFIGLDHNHIEFLKRHLTTSRFIVSSGKAFRYQLENQNSQRMLNAISLPNVSDGCYEFENGVPYRIYFAGIRRPVDSDHQLNKLNEQEIIRLFNMGIHFSNYHEKNEFYRLSLPQRFAFYNNSSLYVMNAPLFSKDDSRLLQFVKNEIKHETTSSDEYPYIGFTDMSRKFKGTSKEIESFIKNFGFKVPEGHVLVLGDNYPMSADSRDFGCVPIDNLLGAPLYRFWPLNAIGKLPQVPYPTNKLTLSILGILTLSGLIFFTNRRLKKNK